MKEKKNNSLFNSIAPIYGLFYKFQKRHYAKIIDSTKREVDFSSVKKIIDIGCGTGALCSALNDRGMEVTGIDPAQKMIKIAKMKTANNNIKFFEGDALEGLPFADKVFDASIASYVLHGLKSAERKQLYFEMARISKQYVIIHDYNMKKSLLTSIVEWMEGGDYFSFIKIAESEMKECVLDLKKCFSDVKVINVGTRANWYICIPKNDCNKL